MENFDRKNKNHASMFGIAAWCAWVQVPLCYCIFLARLVCVNGLESVHLGLIERFADVACVAKKNI